MDLIDARRRIIGGSPHQVTISGTHVHFVTDIAAPLEIVGSGNITVCGKNMLHVYNTSRSAAGITYIFRRNADGEVTSINISGTGTQSNGNYFSNLTYGSPYPIILCDQIISCGSPFVIATLYASNSYLSKFDNGEEYSITLEEALAGKRQDRFYRLQFVPYPYYDAYQNYVETTAYPMVRHIDDKDSTFEPYKGTTAPVGTPRTSFVGINNVWAEDNSEITVKFWTH